MASLLRSCLLGLVLVFACVAPSAAQGRVLNFRFTPTKRTQLAIWIERPDGSFVATIALTEAVALRGIGNRPGALQMNSGFRWPYGRREGVLPIWSHRRAAAPGAQLFPLVIFQDRPEGWASRLRNDSTLDPFFCLSFNASAANDVDAVSCPTTFYSDKGRFLSASDAAKSYGEPFATSPGVEITRILPQTSFYPPRRDFTRFTGICNGDSAGDTSHVPCDTADSGTYAAVVSQVMPDIDAISRATPPADQRQAYQFVVPDAWADGDYVAWIEVNTERDYNATYNATTYPTPTSSSWDSWAKSNGFAYRGQPAVAFSLPFTLSTGGGTFSTSAPTGYADLQGESGTLHPIQQSDTSITDDPVASPGSGADRLRSGTSPRFVVEVAATDPCNSPNPPAACTQPCTTDSDCPSAFLCGTASVCVAQCSLAIAPDAVGSFTAAPYPDPKHSHQWAVLDFVAATSRRPIVAYDLRFTDQPMASDAQFMAAYNAKAATIEAEAVTVCPPDDNGMPVCPTPGAETTVDIGGLHFLTTYNIGVRAVDVCGVHGPLATTTVRTTEIHFTQVSPCFVSTAAYGSPMAPDVIRLRRFRDETLRTTAPGRAFVDAYYAVGPWLANAIRDNSFLRRAARAFLSPAVTGIRLFDALPRSGS